MQYLAVLNGQQQYAGPSFQAVPQFLHDATRNQQAGTASNTSHYRIVNSVIQPAPSVLFTLQNVAYSNRHTSHWQTSAGPNEVISSQQTAGGNTIAFPLLLHNPQTLSTNVQSENPCLQTSYGFKAVTTQRFHQSSISQNPPNNMKLNTTYPQQGTPAHLKQSAVVNNRQTKRRVNLSKTVAHSQHGSARQGLNQNAVGNLTQPISAYNTTTATSIPPQQTACSSTSVHNKWIAPNQIHGHYTTRHASTHSNDPPSYFETMQRINNTVETRSPSSGTIVYDSNMAQETQQYPGQHSLTGNNGGNAAISSNSTVHNQYKTNSFHANSNELPLNPAVAQQQMSSHYMSADRLSMSHTVLNSSATVCTSSPSRGQQFANNATMTPPNQNRQPLTSAVSKSLNLNATQSLPLPSGQSLAGGTQSFMSGSHHVFNAPPAQNVSPVDFLVPATGIGSNRNNPNDGCLPNNATVSKKNLVGMLNDAPQSMQLPKSVSSQIPNTQPSVENDPQMLKILEMLLSVKPNDSSVQQSPGRSGTKAVAVVQPLSQESCELASGDVFSNTTSSESSSNNEKVKQAGVVLHSIEESNLAEENESKASTTEVPSTVPLTQSSSEDQSEKETTPPVVELSTLETTEWTDLALVNLIQDLEKDQETTECSTASTVADTIKQMFWGGSHKALALKLKKGWYKNLMKDVTVFCDAYVKSGSVILLQVKPSLREQLKNYHVLNDDEVYSEVAYKSSWLNVNEQLDDIDKEFGFPQRWKQGLHHSESDDQTDLMKTINIVPASTESEVQNNVLSQTELAAVDSGEEKQASPVETPSIQTASSTETESANSSDPFYSFQIQILSPEEAKRIFEGQEDQERQSTDTHKLTEKVMSSSVETEKPKVLDMTLNDSKLEKRVVTPIKQICCVLKWMDIILGTPNTSSKCMCKESSQKDETLDKDERAVPEDGSPCEASDDGRFHPVMESKDNPNIKFYSFDLCSEVIDLTESDDKNISENSNGSQSSVIPTNEDEDKGFFTSENKSPDWMPDLSFPMWEPEDEWVQEPQNSTVTTQSSSSDRCDEQTQNSTERELQMSDHGEDCGKLKSKEIHREPLLEKKSTKAPLQTSLNFNFKHKTAERKRKRLSSDDEFFLSPKKSKKSKPAVDVDSQNVPEKKCRKVSVDVAEAQPFVSSVKTVELMLFGSASQEKSQISYPEGDSHAPRRAPKVVSVDLCPLRCKIVDRGEYSVKHLIHEKWRKSYQPINIGHKIKRKKQKCSSTSSSGEGLKKEKHRAQRSKTASSKTRDLGGTTKHRRSLKKRRKHSKRLRFEEAATKKDDVTLHQPAAQERIGNEGQDVMPLHENNVLRFSVLPNTFTFKDKSSRRKETTHYVSGKPDHAEENNQRPSKAVVKAKGKWYSHPEKKYKPLKSPGVPKTSSIFHEFQKKYIKKDSLTHR